MAARAACTGPNTVSVHVQFVQTPHKLRITCELRTGTFDAVWRTVPLTGRSTTALSALAQPTALDAL